MVIGSLQRSFCNSDSMYRAGCDPALAPVGETEFVNGVAAMAASGVYGPTKACAGIVNFADLFLGKEVDRVLEMHLARGGERFKGVRYCSVWDADQSIKSTPDGFFLARCCSTNGSAPGSQGCSRTGLSFDGYLYHTQVPEFADLARAFPETTMILDHVGAPVGIGVYAGKRGEVFGLWKKNMQELAACENVNVKLGGLAMQVFRLWLRSHSRTGLLADPCRSVAALHRDDHRAVRAAALHVREQLSGG